MSTEELREPRTDEEPGGEARETPAPDAEEEGGGAWTWVGWGIAIAATVLATILGFHRLGEDSFWVDEASSVMIADQGLSQTWRLLTTQELNGSPYFLVLHEWLRFGQSEAFIRSLSVLFAIGCIPLVYAIGRKLFGPVAGSIAAVLMAINGYFIAYAQEARQYSLALFLCCLATYLLIEGVDRRSWGWWIAYALVAALSVYAHMFSGFVILGHALSLPARRWREVPWARALISFGAIAFLLIPLALFVTNNDRGQIDWVPEPTPELLREGFDDITGFAGETMLWAYGITTALALVGMIVAFVREGAGRRAWGHVVCFTWFLFPILLSYAVSFQKPIFFPRYLIISVAALGLLAGAGLSLIRPRALAFVPAAVMVWLALPGLTTHYDDTQADWRSASAFILEGAEEGDGIIFYSPTGRRPFEYYVSLRGVSEAAALDPLLPPTPFGEYGTDTFLDYMPATTKVTEFANAGAEHERVWLVLGKGGRRKENRLRDLVAGDCPEVFTPPEKFQGIRVLLLQGCR